MMSKADTEKALPELKDIETLLKDVEAIEQAADEWHMSRLEAVNACMELIDDLPVLVEEPIRTVHHLACTGGTLITKCLASMPNVLMLNEVDPLSRLIQNPKAPSFTPTDMIALAAQGDFEIDNSVRIEMFLVALEALKSRMEQVGRVLVLRDHSHSHYNVGDSIPNRPTFREIVAKKYRVCSVVTVRDPIDSFLSLRNKGWNSHFTPSDFNEYCCRYLAFLDGYPNTEIIRYEDFIEKPEDVAAQMCEHLELAFIPEFKSIFFQFHFSGDSGRGGDVIKKHPPREIGDLKSEIKASESYKILVDRLGYAPRA
nr:hypothetical protein [uncultured Cohaesibacter sp.]